MAEITLHGNIFSTTGDLPKIGAIAPGFKLTKNDLSEVTLKEFAEKKVVFNIFPSLDTPVCATTVRTFNKKASDLKDTIVLCISKDLPFAQARFCGAEGLDRVTTLSAFRTGKFGKDYGVEIIDGPLASLFARAIIVLDEDGKVIYKELVKEVAQEPNYDDALKALG